jgi:hypothetical protein
MKDQDKRIQRYPKIFDNAYSTRPASELVCILRRIYYTFSKHRLGEFTGRKCSLGACVLSGGLHCDRGGNALQKHQKPIIVYSYGIRRAGWSIRYMSRVGDNILQNCSCQGRSSICYTPPKHCANDH